jgi:4-hydroxy-2-oxoheptanedioate aldolase
MKDDSALKPNRVKKILREGGVCYGTMYRLLNTPHAISLGAAAGWDYLILDTEHGDYNSSQIAALSLVAKYEQTTLLLRVPDKEYHLMSRPLDLGIEGLILPRVDTPAQVREIIRATRYAPEGERGASISAVSTRYRQVSGSEYLRWANRELLNIIQVESEESLTNLEEMVSTPGIDATMIGPFDLSVDMGIPGELGHPRLKEAFQEVIRVCSKHGVAPGVHLQSTEDARYWVSQGMRFMTVSYDVQLFRTISAQLLGELRRQEP